MRIRKPWFRASKNAWYVEIDGRQVRLAVGKENEKAALATFYKLMAGGSSLPTNEGLLVVTVCDLFLDYSSSRHVRSSYQYYKMFLQDFCRKWPTLSVAELKPFHVTRWLDERSNWKGAKRGAVICIKRAMSWAEQEGLIPASPIKSVKKPACGKRNRVITAEEKRQILEAIRDQAFRDFVFAMQETGCRPGEISRVTAANCDLSLGIWVFDRHKTAAKTGRPRVVYLTPAMLELTKSLIEKYPEGELFRNTRGKAFCKNSIRCRFRRLRKKSPNLAGVVAYSYRHSFATDALVNGVGVAQVAELLGHTSTDMVMKHYGHIADNIEYMRQAALRARQG